LAVLAPEISEWLTIINTLVLIFIGVWTFRELVLRPKLAVVFPAKGEVEKEDTTVVRFHEGFVETEYGAMPHYVDRKVRFLRAIVTNNGLATAHECEAYIKLSELIPVFESLNWKHWPREREWMYGKPPLTKEEYMKKIQYDYLTNRKTELPNRVPRKLDLILLIDDNTAYALGERQAEMRLPYEGRGELALSWSSAWRSHVRKLHVSIRTWEDADFQVLDC
jgi:hypothetical protein